MIEHRRESKVPGALMWVALGAAAMGIFIEALEGVLKGLARL